MVLPFDYIGYKRWSENKRFPNHRWYSDATLGGNGWMVSIVKQLEKEKHSNFNVKNCVVMLIYWGTIISLYEHHYTILYIKIAIFLLFQLFDYWADYIFYFNLQFLNHVHVITVKPVLCYLPRERWNRVAKYRCNWYEKQCEGKLELRSHNTGYCLIEVVTKVDLTIIKALSTLPSNM
jgi:hypothetical protein